MANKGMTKRRRQFIAALAAGSASAIAGCNGGSGSDSTSGTGTPTGTGASNDGGSAGQASGAAYPAYRGDFQRRAYFPDRGPQEEAPSRTWSTGIDNLADSSPIVAAGTLYMAAGSNVYAFDPDSGEQLWQTSVENGTSSGIAYDDGTLYVPGDSTSLYALDATTGTQQWAYETGESIVYSPVVADGKVFVPSTTLGGSGVLAAVEASSGNEAWTEPIDLGISGTPAVSDGTVYYAGSDGVTAIDTDGNEKWAAPAAITRGVEISTDGDTVYYTEDGAEGGQGIEQVNARLVAINPADGSEKWEYTTESPSMYGPAVVGSDALYFSAIDEVFKIDKESGSEEWRTSVSGYEVSGAPVVYGDTVYMTSGDFDLDAINTSDGSKRWTGTFKHGRYDPVLVDGTLYLSVGKNVRAFE